MASSRLTLRRRRVEEGGGLVVVRAGEWRGWLWSGWEGVVGEGGGALWPRFSPKQCLWWPDTGKPVPGFSLWRALSPQRPCRAVPAGAGCPGPAAAQCSVAPGALRQRLARGFCMEVLSSLGAELSAEQRLCGPGVAAGCAASGCPQ